jgi:hypothetical protein
MCDCKEGACQGDINAILAELNRRFDVLAKVVYDGLTALEEVLEWKDRVNLRLDSIYAELDSINDELAGCDDDEECDEEDDDDLPEITDDQVKEIIVRIGRAINESA